MATFELILLLLCAVIISAVLERIVPKVSIPLIQIALGVVIACLATQTLDVTLAPEFFLILFIAPLLYNEARQSDKLGLLKNIKVILSLAIGLVIAIMITVGFSVHWLIPTIPLAAAFALGAALGPTDAVAVTSLSETAQLDRNVGSRLSGEALLNDASGVVGFQFAVAATVSTVAFSPLHGALDFTKDFFGGIILGLAIAYISFFFFKIIDRAELGSNIFFVLFDITLPFVIYLIAEIIGVSGILAVVSAGLVVGIVNPHRIGPSASRLNITMDNVWHVICFTLNGIVFVLLGMQLPRAFLTTWNDAHISNLSLMIYILIITAILIITRFVWLLVMDSLLKNPETGKRFGMNKQVIFDAFIATIGGPKGAVTLSVIMSLPFLLNDGTNFPERNTLIFLASGAILLTLLLANFLLPVLAPTKEDSRLNSDDAEAIANIMRNVIDRLTIESTPSNEQATHVVVRAYTARLTKHMRQNELEQNGSRCLNIEVLKHMQDYVSALVDKGEVDEYAAYKCLGRMSRRIGYLSHRSDGVWWFNYLRRHLRTVIIAITHYIHSLKEQITAEDGVSAQTLVQINALSEGIRYLDAYVEDPDAPYPAEVVAEVKANLQTQHRQLIQGGPSATSFAKKLDSVEEIRKKAYYFELEEIHDATEQGIIKRSVGKQMRDNVYLMMVDLEGPNR